jgi:hypothetical protein
MNEPQTPTAIDEHATAVALSTNGDTGGVAADASPPGRGVGLPRLPGALLVALTSCSSVLGNADPWLPRNITHSVPLETDAGPHFRRITLAEACRIASDFSKRLDQAYACAARAEAEAEAFWEDVP